MWVRLLCLAAAVLAADAAGAGAARLVCYVESSGRDFSECTHLVYAGDARGEKLDGILKDYRKNNPRLKIVLRVTEIDKDLPSLLKSKHVQGLEIYDAHKSLNRTKITEAVEAAKAAVSSAGGGPLFLALPAHPELLAKYYDLRTLLKKVDLMMVQTHALGMVKKTTYHPSRLSGLWDMMNTDSVVDLVVGLGVPASKVVISLPATARKFSLLNESLSTPGSPTTEDEPTDIDQSELCKLLQDGRWTLERDQDLSAPYAFKNKTWISFEDSSSVDVKGKYVRVRGLAGLALHNADRDTETSCGPSLKTALAKVLNQQSRAPRAAVLRSLEHEILSVAGQARALDALQVSPYRITQVVDSDGVIHSIREDTRTEFTCSRQGYFVHPRSCARFYRCVKFDQLSPEYTVFEFDCPAGLAFDSRYEVCVWPGSLPHSQACPGSSEIAPVPQTRFVCPEHEGYYADPENCRWFFACLDHGKAPLTAYEFRCPFGLGFDASRLTCDWPWLVPACGNIARYEAEAHGFSAAILTGAAGYQGQTADAINVAAHQSLVSGASLNNLVGIQSGFLSQDDVLDSNFIASQEYANNAYNSNHGNGISHGSQEQSYALGDVGSVHSNLGLVQTTNYNDEGKYTSGSIILDEYRLPSKSSKSINHGAAQNLAQESLLSNNAQYNNGYSSSYVNNAGQAQYISADSEQSGAYVHDPSGDYAVPYSHEDSPAVPYIHSDSGYKQSADYYDYNRYSGSSQGSYNEKYQDNSGQYRQETSGAYGQVESNGNYKSYSNVNSADYSGSYTQDNSGQYVAGIYRANGQVGSYNSGSSSSEGNANSAVNIKQYHGAYSQGNSGNYLSDPKAYTGASHTLTAGAINVGLVGKTTLVDAGYTDQTNAGYNNYGSTVSHGTIHETVHPGHLSLVSQPAVSIQHLGTDSHNLDGYSFVTTPTSSGVPTTATPIAFTTALPSTTFRTTFVPEPPRSSVKQIFGVTQPAVTYVQPAVVAIKQEHITPKVEVTDYNLGIGSQNSGYSFTAQQKEIKSESSGYHYTKPEIKFEDGVTYTTPAPVVTVSTYKPQGFSHNQHISHNVDTIGFEYSTATPVNEPAFKKLVAYTTGPSVTSFVQPTIARVPQSFSQQTFHKLENSNVHNAYVQSDISYEQPKQLFVQSTPQPVVVSTTYQPQTVSHQTLHEVDAAKVNSYSESSDAGYVYNKPATGYTYSQPKIKLEELPNSFGYSTPPPVVSTYRPQAFSHQTIHKSEQSHQYVPVSTTPSPSIEVTYQQPAVTIYQNPLLKYSTVTPVTYVEQKYTPQVYTHQTLHQTEDRKVYTPSVDASISTYQSSTSYKSPKIETQYTTAQPEFTLQPVVSNYQPQVISHQTLHEVELSKVNTHSQGESGYEYVKPAVKYEEEPKTFVQYSTPAPVTVSTYQPSTYSHQTVHKFETQKFVPVSTTAAPKIELTYQQPTVSFYENPFLKYTQKEIYSTPTPAVEKYTPVIQQHEVTHTTQEGYQTPVQQTYLQPNLQLSHEGYSYSQPEIQRNDESFNTGKTYSDATLVSHQVYHQANTKVQPGKDIVFVSTTPATLAYEDHYIDYDLSKKTQYSAPDYIPPRTNFQESYTVSSPATTKVYQSSSNYDTLEQNNFKSVEYSQQHNVPVEQFSFGTAYSTQPRKESIHLSTFPGTTVVTKYKQVAQETPEIQLAYKSEEYLPPVVSTSTALPTSAYKFSTREYLPPSTTVKPIIKSTTQIPKYKFAETTPLYEAPEYLPPQENKDSKVLHFESFGLKNNEYSNNFNIDYNVNQEYSTPGPSYSSTFSPVQRKQNIVVETVKSNLLGFGTVGPDAGLVSPVTYTTSKPVVSTYRPTFKSTVTTPVYVESSTQYKAPEYLPPGESQKNLNRNPYRPVQRKQNVVVQNAKSQLHSYSSVGTDASLVTPISYSTQGPVFESSSETYSRLPLKVTTPVLQEEIVEVTPPAIPARRVKPKVAVVTKINDFNPLLVRKLGAVCSCQSPVLVLRGKRPNTTPRQDFDDYSNEYDDVSRGDINDNEWAHKSARLRVPAVKTITTSPVVTSTFNPIIVPDDSYYQDLPDESNYDSSTLNGREIYSENFVSSTPAVSSTTERYVKIRPRVKSVTVAPTYKTVLLNQEVAPSVVVKQESVASVDSQAFDRYGPGGWRSRDETLQGSVDCQRAGLFRHPKQCNKFYACRWDCTKQRFTLHVFNCPVHLSFDESLGACNWPSQGPACQGDTLLTNAL